MGIMEDGWTGRVEATIRKYLGPGHVAQSVRSSSQYTKVAGSMPGQGTCKNQPMST